jgi:hypothetical protein
MNKVTYLLALALLAGVGRAASLKQDTQELVVNGALDPEGIGGSADFSLSVGYGYFIADNLEGGVEAAFADNDLLTSYGFGAFGEYNFNIGTPFVPFAGGKLNWAKVEVDDLDKNNDALVVGAYGGVKFFLAENVAISGQLNVDLASDDIYVNKNKLDNTDVTLTLGMRFFLP